MPRIKDLSDILSDRSWTWLSSTLTDRHNFTPNKILQNFSTREAAIVLRRADAGGFSISETALKYYSERVNDHRIEQAYVVLLEKNNDFIDADTIGNVSRTLNGCRSMPSVNPAWSPYFWLTDRFEFSSPDDFQGGRML